MDRVEGKDQLEWRIGGQPGDVENLKRDVVAGHLPGLVASPGDGVAGEVIPGETRSGERGGHQVDRVSGAASDVGDAAPGAHARDDLRGGGEESVEKLLVVDAAPQIVHR